MYKYKLQIPYFTLPPASNQINYYILRLLVQQDHYSFSILKYKTYKRKLTLLHKNQQNKSHKKRMAYSKKSLLDFGTYHATTKTVLKSRKHVPLLSVDNTQ